MSAAWKETDPGLSDILWGVASAGGSGVGGVLAWEKVPLAIGVAVGVGTLVGLGRFFKNVVTIRTQKLEKEVRRLQDRGSRSDETPREVIDTFIDEGEAILRDITVGGMIDLNARARHAYERWSDRVESYLRQELGEAAASAFFRIRDPAPNQSLSEAFSGVGTQGKGLKKAVERRIEALRDIRLELEEQ